MSPLEQLATAENPEAEKAHLVVQAWDEHPGRGVDGHLTITVPGGREVTIGHVAAADHGDTLCVEVWTGPPAGAPQWRIINPPLLVPDGQGDITITDPDGRTTRYRHDPIAAIALAISGGAR